MGEVAITTHQATAIAYHGRIVRGSTPVVVSQNRKGGDIRIVAGKTQLVITPTGHAKTPRKK